MVLLGRRRLNIDRSCSLVMHASRATSTLVSGAIWPQPPAGFCQVRQKPGLGATTPQSGCLAERRQQWRFRAEESCRAPALGSVASARRHMAGLNSIVAQRELLAAVRAALAANQISTVREGEGQLQDAIAPQQPGSGCRATSCPGPRTYGGGCNESPGTPVSCRGHQRCRSPHLAGQLPRTCRCQSQPGQDHRYPGHGAPRPETLNAGPEGH